LFSGNLKISGAAHRTLLLMFEVPESSEHIMRIPWSATRALQFESIRMLFCHPRGHHHIQKVRTATYGGKVTMNNALRVDCDAITQFFLPK
jgi:hypothetical protein